jgi:hypothetical protein
MITDFFEVPELVCPEVYHKYNSFALNFFDTKLLIVMEAIRSRLNKKIIINDWQIHGQFSQRGFRCVQCQIMTDLYKSGNLFTDPHALGKAFDFDVEGLVASEVRDYLIKNATLWPYPIRLEADVLWCHIDTYNDGSQGKVILFK